jgi:hypothetical protein
MNHSKLLTSLVLLFAPGVATADLISGVVVDANGLPVPNVNIVADSQGGGGDGNLANAGTDANGVFNATIDPGLYDFTFEPPAPPAAVALVTVVGSVLVNGTTSMGTVVLGPAVALSGRVVRAGSIPVPGVNLDVIDLATNDNMDIVGDQTNALGRFIIAVPIGSLELRLDTTPILVPLLAPHSLVLTTGADLDLGDLLLLPGFKVTAAVFDTGFSAVQDLDVDVRDTSTGDKLYTPGDNTDNNGFVDFVVRQGIFDIEFCPQFADGLVAQVQPDVAVSSTTNLGIVTLVPGVQLSGTVTSHLGQAVQDIDLDLRDSATQFPVFLCNDNSNPSGLYRVIVPPGQFDLVFTPPYSMKLGSKSETGVVVSGNTVLNSILPFCDCGTGSGSGVAGTGGHIPQIAPVGGSLRLGNPNWGFEVTNGLGGASGMAFLGFGPSCGVTHGQFGGNLLSVNRVRLVPFQLGGAPGVAGAGSVSFTSPLPELFPSAGIVLTGGAFVLDSGATSGRALTQLLCGALCQ